MTKHVIDQPGSSRNSALARFARIARTEGPQKAPRTLLSQARDRAGKRLGAYARIARGKQA